jgi:glycine betaine/proline transport system ATP-binding protein
VADGGVEPRLRPPPSEGAQAGGRGEAVIACREVWKLYGPQAERKLAALGGAAPSAEALREAGLIAAVRDVTLTVGRGEMLVVMGLSGSGKSTLLRCMSRLVEVTAGVVEVEGRDVGRLSERELIALRRDKMGMVFQNFALLPHRSVLDNVAFPLEMRGADRHARRARALEVIRLVGLEGREDYFPRELSGGQQQRVGIARSLAVEPDIWFLDEPFSALDPLIRREMQDEFLRLQGLLGKTIVFVTHDFDEALRLADRIAVMKDGAVEQVDTPDRLVLAPATPYVAKFTADVDAARVVHAAALARPLDGAAVEGAPAPAEATLHDLARQLVEDRRERIPVADEAGRVLGAFDRAAALDVLFGAPPERPAP